MGAPRHRTAFTRALPRLVVASVVRTLAFTAQDVADLELAVTEACANAVRHAYGDGTGGNVEVSLRPRANGVELQVADTGAGIELPLPDPPTAPSPDGGMGLPLIRAVVDELAIANGSGGRGTVVRMTKRSAPTRELGRSRTPHGEV